MTNVGNPDPNSAAARYAEITAPLGPYRIVITKGGLEAALKNQATAATKVDAFLHPQDAQTLTRASSNQSEIQSAFDSISNGQRDTASLQRYINELTAGAKDLNSQNLVTEKITVGDISKAVTQALSGAGVAQQDIEQALSERLP